VGDIIMSILFEPFKIKQVVLPNRFMRSATFDGAADAHGHVTEAQIALFNSLAEGGVGLIVTGITYVHPLGQRREPQPSIADDSVIAGFCKLTESVHNRGAKIAVQLFHAGREGGTFQMLKGAKAIAPSFIDYDPYCSQTEYRSMTDEEIWDAVRAFGDAALRAREAGFDAVQLHGAHAYLFSQFLSSFTNRRKDEWGGSLENRLRFHREVLADIRKKVGDNFPVFIKLGVQDSFPEGLQFEEGMAAARILAKAGFDGLEISVGLRGKAFEESEFRTGIDDISKEAYLRSICSTIKRQVNVPVAMIGGLRTFELMEEIIRKGEADLISMSRPLVREPGLIKDWKQGDYHRVRCISCNQCVQAMIKGGLLHCPLETKISTKDV
jgi:2,4-dienoyl-CoA reductase-like NADH-dependent reductase (Old Yellow Enzyme family)